MNALITLFILTILVGWLLINLTMSCCCAMLEAVTVIAPLMRRAMGSFRAMGQRKSVLLGRSHIGKGPQLELVQPQLSFVHLHSR